MADENANYISELVVTNPVGATDTVSTLDNHDRMLKRCLANQFPNFAGTTGVPKSVTLTEDQINDAARKAATATISALWDFTTEPTINSELVAVEPILQRAISDDDTLVLTDAPKHIYMTAGAAKTVTIPANGSVAFVIGTAIPIVNQSGNSWSIAITTDTMTLEGDGATGTRTLADDGIATILKVTATAWMISGGTSLT